MDEHVPTTSIDGMSPREVIETIIGLLASRYDHEEESRRDGSDHSESIREIDGAINEAGEKLYALVPNPSLQPIVVTHSSRNETFLVVIQRYPGEPARFHFDFATSSEELRWPDPEPHPKGVN